MRLHARLERLERSERLGRQSGEAGGCSVCAARGPEGGGHIRVAPLRVVRHVSEIGPDPAPEVCVCGRVLTVVLRSPPPARLGWNGYGLAGKA